MEIGYGLNLDWRFVCMKIRLALLLCLLTVLLTACGYWIVEDVPMQIGASSSIAAVSQ